MHSFGYRANALLTFAVTIRAVMCAMASFSDNFNTPSPTAHVQVLNINRFQRKSDGDDEGRNLRGRDLNLALPWQVMPKTGKMFADKIVMSGFRLPKAYR